jgi:hypothetical protein
MEYRVLSLSAEQRKIQMVLANSTTISFDDFIAGLPERFSQGEAEPTEYRMNLEMGKFWKCLNPKTSTCLKSNRTICKIRYSFPVQFKRLSTTTKPLLALGRKKTIYL